MGFTVNGEPHEWDPQPTVGVLVERLGLPDRGIAVAVDGAVVPRGRWDSVVPADAVVEVVTAVQGG
ncbi:sulfur carrier protein ThiS [Gordonia otitidis]|uniref:Thiamine biosynthesis protein ThiS n=1 Tax=Gordonia otitidis (strain DSM 44809 / CCUG 52243 / JCM 12355 / NBRC 100426 / IFM 10032) TaxID=1108044 RepID=H5TJY0_GORO1|nr:sulfur carrier protein ThiS [Gordonia otitidis]UEA61328.1 sulfur carrier protein ThiS [Gordonia otitidis]GAB33788.1 thiamine biosynthesis protein ThiS [Gordonia otitidis NBRC 100426]